MRAKKIYDSRFCATLEFMPQLFNKEANFSISLLNPPGEYHSFPGASPIYWGSNPAAFIAILVVDKGATYVRSWQQGKCAPPAGFPYKIQIPK